MRDFADPFTISAELAGVADMVCALYVQFAEDKVLLCNDTIASALYGIELHLERLSEAVGNLTAQEGAQQG